MLKEHNDYKLADHAVQLAYVPSCIPASVDPVRL